MSYFSWLVLKHTRAYSNNFSRIIQIESEQIWIFFNVIKRNFHWRNCQLYQQNGNPRFIFTRKKVHIYAGHIRRIVWVSFDPITMFFLYAPRVWTTIEIINARKHINLWKNLMQTFLLRALLGMLTLHVDLFRTNTHTHTCTHANRAWQEGANRQLFRVVCCCNFCLPRILKYYEARRMDQRRCEQLCKQDKFYDSASRTNFVYFSQNASRIFRAMWFVMRISRLTPSDARPESSRRYAYTQDNGRSEQNSKVSGKVKGDNCHRCIITAFNRLINKY